jgi:putative alkyl quinolone biosynthesis protein PqsB
MHDDEAELIRPHRVDTTPALGASALPPAAVVLGAGVSLPPARMYPESRGHALPYACPRPRADASQMAIDLALAACGDALKQAGCRPDDVELIAGMSVSPDHLSDDPAIAGPRLGHPLQRELKARQAFVFDLIDADWGAAIDMVSAFASSTGLRRVLLFRAECTHGLVPDETSGFAVPDGAGALVMDIAPAVVYSAGHLDVAGGFRGAELKLAPPEIRATTNARAILTFPFQPALRAAVEDTMHRIVEDDAARLPPADVVVREDWFGAGAGGASLPDSIPPSIGPFALPLVLSRHPRGGSLASVLNVSFSPFHLRCGGQRLLI